MKAIDVNGKKTVGNKEMFDLINDYTNNSLQKELEETEEVSCADYPGLLEEGSIFGHNVYGNASAWSLLLEKVQNRMPKKIEEVQKWAHEVLEIDKHFKNAQRSDLINNQMIMGENGKVENAKDSLSQLMSNLI